LVIDQEDWRVFKKKEKADLEPQHVEKVVEKNDNGEVVVNVLEEEIQFEMIESRNKNVMKQKVEESDQPSKKKRKYDSIMNWGEAGEDEDDLDLGIKAWLMVVDRCTIHEENDRVEEVIEIQEPKDETNRDRVCKEGGRDMALTQR
jgi:hypothetical protein